ncbi:hypothetical protein C0J52_01502 [Blattella germanica]|nr:hypothetical protein C0J52_01502 [Blattella germanica]
MHLSIMNELINFSQNMSNRNVQVYIRITSDKLLFTTSQDFRLCFNLAIKMLNAIFVKVIS